MRLLRRKRTIFLSSTEQDLENERAIAKVSIERADLAVSWSKDLVSATPDPWSECARRIAAADGYLLLLGERYGSPLEPSGLSFTHAEYELAQSHKLPTYVYVKRGALAAAGNDEDGDRLRDFHELVTRTHTRHEPFGSLPALEEAIGHSLDGLTFAAQKRPDFRAQRRSESQEWAYTIGTLRQRVLAKHPLEVVLMDGKVALEADVPAPTLRTRLLERALEIRDELRHLGVTAQMFNEVWTEGGSREDRFTARVRRVCESGDLVLCFVHGKTDVGLTLRFDERVGKLVVVVPIDVVEDPDLPADHVIEYVVREINESEVAARTMRYLRTKVAQHVEGTFRDVA